MVQQQSHKYFLTELYTILLNVYDSLEKINKKRESHLL